MKPVVWALHEGKIGLANQALGVAEAIGLPVIEKRLSIRMPWRILPPALWLAPLHAVGGDVLAPPWPVAVVAAGNRAAAPAAAMRKVSGGRCLAIQVQNPHLPLNAFDLLVLPEHDAVTGPNVLVSLGAVHRVTRVKLDEAAALWGLRLATLPHPRVAVLIGGDNGSYRLPVQRMSEIAGDLKRLAEQGAGLMVTTSRRTPADFTQLLRAVLSGCAAILWDGAGENPYLGYLALADHVLATADSVSMVSEASMTGKPVHILDLPGGSAKFRRFHDAMREAGIIRAYAGALDEWTYAIRDDTSQAGVRIRQMIDAGATSF